MSDNKVPPMAVLTPLELKISGVKVLTIRKLLYLWMLKKTKWTCQEFHSTKHTKGISLKIIMRELKCSRATAESYNQAIKILEEI